jgi:MFS family permease
MNHSVDKLLEIAGNKGRYQYFILAMGFFLWITLDLMSISLPYLEKTRTISIDNTPISLNYTHCDIDYKNLTIETSKHSWVIEYDIECDKLKTGLIGSVTFTGVLFGSILFQYLPDVIGRKKSIIIGSSLYSFTLLIFCLSNNIYTIYLFIFMSQMTACIASLSIFMLSSEITDKNARSFFGAVINSAFSFSGVIFIFIYRYYDNWRLNFVIASIFNMIICYIFYKFSIESPRYYLAKEDNKSFIQSIIDIAKFNNREEEFKREIRKDFEIETNEMENLTENETKHIAVVKKTFNLFSFLHYKSIRYTFLINCYLWFSTSGIYYGLSIYLKNLPGDIYFNGSFIYISEIFSYIVSGWIIDKPQFGRRMSIFLFEAISLICYLCLMTLSLDDNQSTIISFIARFSISGVYNIIYTYCAEVYPTVLRAKGLGFHSICARLGGIIFPLLIEIMGPGLIVVFCCLNIWALILTLWLPETLGKEVREDIKD